MPSQYDLEEIAVLKNIIASSEETKEIFARLKEIHTEAGLDDHPTFHTLIADIEKMQAEANKFSDELKSIVKTDAFDRTLAEVIKKI